MSDGRAWDTNALYTTGTLNVISSAIPEPATGEPRYPEGGGIVASAGMHPEIHLRFVLHRSLARLAFGSFPGSAPAVLNSVIFAKCSASITSPSAHLKPFESQVVDQIGIKPTTSSLRTTRSIQLSYWPEWGVRYCEINARK